MVRYNVGRYITAIVVLSIALFLVISFLRNNLSFNDLKLIWADIATTISIVTIICALFISWGWKWKIFQRWLVPFPCLSGKWEGEMLSTFAPGDTPIPVEMKIKHHFFNIQIKVTTAESKSISTCGSFDIDEDRGLKQLIYSYQSIPKAVVRNRSEIHFGTTRLEINDDATEMSGDYWTDRKTTGDIKVSKSKFIDRKNANDNLKKK